jgi:ribosomal protein S18 acetylase RimI-like enzyme
VRTLRADDLPEVVRLMGMHWPEPVEEDVVRRGWTAPGVDPKLDGRLEPDGYAFVENFPDERVWIDLFGSPSHDLYDWAESRARELGTRILTGAWSSNEAVLAELRQRGFRPVRHSHRMQIDLTGDPPAPEWPESVDVRAFRPGDERVFYDLEQETFRDTWEPLEETFEEWRHWMLDSPAFAPELWFLAVSGDEPIGIAICHPRPASEDLGWVRVLGVRRSWRRRGVGRALLLHAFSELRRRGFRRAGLGVDAESITGANLLYERAGMRVVARFDVYEKGLA